MEISKPGEQLVKETPKVDHGCVCRNIPASHTKPKTQKLTITLKNTLLWIWSAFADNNVIPWSNWWSIGWQMFIEH